MSLIEVNELKMSLSDASCLVFDCRFDLTHSASGYTSYQEGHIPGAAYAHMDHDLAGAKNGTNGRHPLPNLAEWEKTYARLGISPDKTVIAYDNQGGMFAVRLWWMLRASGHSRVKILNGGYTAWLAAGLPTQTGIESYTAASLTTLKPFERLFKVDQIMANLKDHRYTVLDARAADRFRGENETLDPVAGHIPGALNRSFKENLDDKGFFKHPETLKNEFLKTLGSIAPSRIIHQCGSGVTACHNLLAMELAGLESAGIYAGSWSEWSANPERPVAVGNA